METLVKKTNEIINTLELSGSTITNITLINLVSPKHSTDDFLINQITYTTKGTAKVEQDTKTQGEYYFNQKIVKRSKLIANKQEKLRVALIRTLFPNMILTGQNRISIDDQARFTEYNRELYNKIRGLNTMYDIQQFCISINNVSPTDKAKNLGSELILLRILMDVLYYPKQ